MDGKNLYYRISDLLPQYVSFSEAANIIGLSESQASKLARKGTLPFRILWIGNSRVVSVKSLMTILGIQDSIVHPDDVENGASHVGEE
ncbi:helix-turn-helix domain-containing protein [Streptomyces muensis]|uniref:Helix-turn-helix domain-containing protein n=1 Tax=Streptomyces muensis TaxID=1077944 RepID=A0A9X1PYK5_STRM4|nr:helix-turn-helix domain-containing protein [Streptomyces muensis]MCF1595747.1 helix-turn-helix domain-containing protein [Streptomyces muensis]